MAGQGRMSTTFMSNTKTIGANQVGSLGPTQINYCFIFIN